MKNVLNCEFQRRVRQRKREEAERYVSHHQHQHQPQHQQQQQQQQQQQHQLNRDERSFSQPNISCSLTARNNTSLNNNNALYINKNGNGKKTLYNINTDNSFSFSHSLASTDQLHSDENFRWQRSSDEKSLSQNSFCEKSICEKSISVGTKGSISAASSSTNLPYCGRPYVHKMHTAQKCRTSEVHKANIGNCSGPYVHKVSSVHKDPLCVLGDPPAHTEEAWQAVELQNSIRGNCRNSFGQKYPQIIGGKESENNICGEFEAGRSGGEKCGKCGSPFSSTFPQTPIYANVRILKLPRIGE